MDLDETLASLRQMIDVKLLQRIAGDIHDCDITIEYVNHFQDDTSDSQALLEYEQRLRDSYILKLMNLIEEEDWKCLTKFT